MARAVTQSLAGLTPDLPRKTAMQRVQSFSWPPPAAPTRTCFRLLLTRLWLALGTALRVWAAAEPSTGPIQLRPPESVVVAGVPLDVGDYAVPTATDWNGDGYLDLLVGYRPADKIALFLNYGTTAQPRFVSAGHLQAAGLDIVVKSGAGGSGAPAPWVGDFDGDGDRDLLVGSDADGSSILFRNIGTDAAPALANGARLTLWNGNPLTVGAAATPCFADWDDDGRPDLLSGAGDGTVFFFRNIGTRATPWLSSGLRLQAGGVQLNLGSHSIVRVYDWDGDGLNDLVCSSSTGVYWCRNAGTKTAPALQARLALAAPNASGQIVAIYSSNRMRLDLADWNNSGLPVLLLGNVDGTVWSFEGYRFGITAFRRSADGQVVLQWNSAPYLRYSVLTGPSVLTAKDVVGSGVASGGKTTTWTNRFLTRHQYFRVRTP